MDRVFRIRTWGRFALWTNPHFKGDPYTYPVPTHGGLNGLIRAIYWKPEFEIEVLRVSIVKPIRYNTQGHAALQNRKDRYTSTLQSVTMLQNVEYIIEYRFKLNPLRTDNLAKYIGETTRRLTEQVQRCEPHFGRRECRAHWEYLPPEAQAPAPLPINMDLGMMYFDLLPINIAEDRWEPLFFHATLVNGVLTFPEEMHEKRRGPLFIQRNKVHRTRNPEVTHAP